SDSTTPGPSTRSGTAPCFGSVTWPRADPLTSAAAGSVPGRKQTRATERHTRKRISITVNSSRSAPTHNTPDMAEFQRLKMLELFHDALPRAPYKKVYFGKCRRD